MANSIASRHGNSDTSLEHTCLTATTTTDATATTVFSFKVGASKHVLITALVLVRKSDYSLSSSQNLTVGFLRGSGNVSRQGSIISNIISNFPVLKPTVDLQANTSTQSIDVVVTGLAATTLVWIGHIDIAYNT